MLRRLGRVRKMDEQAGQVPDYLCPRCGQTVPRLSPGDYLSTSEHRALHLAEQWRASLDQSTGWIEDPDGGLRPVVE
jgi:hypothetical protein